MATLTITKTYADGQVLFESDLDAMKDSIETFINVTKLNDDNLQDGGITASAKLVNASITAGKIAADAVITSKILDANVTTPKIADDAVTTAKIPNNAITAPKIPDGELTTAKYADSSLTMAKRPTRAVSATAVAGGIAKSSSSGNSAQTVGTSDTVITNLSVTLTTTGKPVRVWLQPDGSNNNSLIQPTSSGGARLGFFRNSSANLGLFDLEEDIQYICGAFSTMDLNVSAGTYTYTAEARQGTSAPFNARYVILCAAEEG